MWWGLLLVVVRLLVEVDEVPSCISLNREQYGI